MGNDISRHARLSAIELALSNVCNMHPRCNTCFTQRSHTQTDLADNEVVHNVINHIGKIDKLNIGGLGEPTLHPLFFKIIENGRKKVHFLTNGINLSEKHIPIIVENVYGFNISLDAASPSMYAFMRKDAELFDKIIRIVKKISSAKKGASTPVISLSFVISRYNLHEVVEFVKLAGYAGADMVIFYRLNPLMNDDYTVEKNGIKWNYSSEKVDTSSREFKAVILEALEEAKRKGVSVKTLFGYSYDSGEGHIKNEIQCSDYILHELRTCHIPFSSAFIRPNGDLTLCCHTYDYAVGNILQSGLEELYYESPILNNVRENLLQGVLPFYCDHCDWIPENITRRAHETEDIYSYFNALTKVIDRIPLESFFYHITGADRLSVDDYISMLRAILSYGDIPVPVSLTKKIAEYDRSYIGMLVEEAENSYNLGKVNAAMAILTACREIDPLNATIWNDIGAIHFEQGDLENCKKCFEKALSLDPKNNYALTNLRALQNGYADASEVLEGIQLSIPMR